MTPSLDRFTGKAGSVSSNNSVGSRDSDLGSTSLEPDSGGSERSDVTPSRTKKSVSFQGTTPGSARDLSLSCVVSAQYCVGTRGSTALFVSNYTHDSMLISNSSHDSKVMFIHEQHCT